MKEGWELKSLDEIFEVKSSKRVHKSDWKDTGVPFYRAREVVKLAQNGFVDNELFISEDLYEKFTSERGAPKEGDIIVSAVGTLGLCYLVKKSDRFYFKDASVLWLESKSELYPRYIEYAFKSDLVIKQVMYKSMGATVGTLTISRAKIIKIPIPPLQEQKQIIAILDQAFTAIDQAKANIEKNIENAKELFQSKLNDIFSQGSDDWEEMELGELGTLTSSKRIYKKEYVSNGIPFYRSKEIKELGNNKEISLELFITEKRYDEIKKKFGIPQKGDILLTAVGTIGEMYVVNENDKFYFKDGNIMWLKDFHSLNSYYLKYALTNFVEQLKAMSQGSAYSALTIEKLKKYSIPVPSLSEQLVIIDKLDQLRNKTTLLTSLFQNKLNSLEELKKSILQKAFAGELTEKAVAV